MASKRARKRARQAASRARGGARITKKQARAGRKRDGRSAQEIVALSNVRRMARKRIGEIGPGGGVRSIGRGLVKSPLGRKALTVARQQFARIPGIGRFAGSTRRARAASVSLTPAVRSTRAVAVRAAAPVAIGAGAAGLAFEAGRNFPDIISGGIDVAKRIRGGISRRSRGQAVPFTPGGIVPTDSITHTWVANGVPFAQLADGRVMVRRKNGTIKTFRRPRPIVLGRNPGVRDIVRADKKIDALLKVVRKRFPPARRNPRHSQQHN